MRVMLRVSNSFYDRAILSLRTGGKIGIADAPVINPNNLKIEGWYARDVSQKGDFVLPFGEVRDFITKGLVVNDHDSITSPDDLIRLKPILDIKFELIGKSVVTESNKKLGKVIDYAVDDGFYIQRIYVNPPLLRGLSGEQLLIGRTEIVEITDKQLTVSDATVKVDNATPLKVNA